MKYTTYILKTKMFDFSKIISRCLAYILNNNSKLNTKVRRYIWTDESYFYQTMAHSHLSQTNVREMLENVRNSIINAQQKYFGLFL